MSSTKQKFMYIVQDKAFWIALMMAMVFFAVGIRNNRCKARHCDKGSPIMMQGECVCMEIAR